MLQPGDQLGRYQIQRRLGQGGMGTLFLARDPLLERLVAVKLFLGDLDREDVRARFSQEARAVASLNHSNIVTVYDYGEVSSQPYIVMEYVEGKTVVDVIRSKTAVGLSDKLRWLEELCGAVAYAHQIGIIHRDIKPANLMIDVLGRLKVLDFGIARMRGTLASQTTALIGTPGYMAPEQIRGGTIDHRSDLFSIGVVGYELLSYVEAFPGDTAHAITRRILEVAPTPIVDLVPDIHPGLAGIVERALEKDAQARFQDADDMRAAIASVRQSLDFGISSETVTSARSAAVGTGEGPSAPSSRVPSREPYAVTVLTPPPTGRRTDREALIRRRAQQIEAGLNEARAFLAAGKLEAAQAACERVLIFDETDTQAVEVYRSIERARARQGAVALVNHGRRELDRGALAVAADLLAKARALDPSAPETESLEGDLRAARQEHDKARKRAEELELVIASTQQALVAGRLEVALGRVKEALEIDHTYERALRLEKEIVARLAAESVKSEAETVGGDNQATVLVPIKVRTRESIPSTPKSDQSGVTPKEPAHESFLRREATRLFTACLSLGPAVTRGFSEAAATFRHWPRRTRGIVVGSAAAMAVALGVVAWFTAGPLSPVVQGPLIIDAVPWGVVTAVTAEDGAAPPQLPPAAETPVLLRLKPGRYRISMTGPPPESVVRVFTVTVETSVATTAPLQRFQAISAEDYFNKYLPAPVAEGTTP